MARRGGKLLFAPRRKRRPGCLVTVLFLLLALGLTLGLNAANNGYVSLAQQHVTVPGLDRELEGFKILHISDLQGKLFGADQQRLHQVIRLERYHAVCLTGDMVGEKGDPGPLLALLRWIPQDIPVFLIAGDDDPPALNSLDLNSQEALSPFILRAQEQGAIYLDSPQRIQVGRRSVWFSPASLYTTDLQAAGYALQARQGELLQTGEAAGPEGAARLRAVGRQLEALGKAQQASKQMDPRDAFVLLSHAPLDTQQVAALHEETDTGRRALNFPGMASLILSGHWNDGQWRLPLFGPVWMPASAQDLSGWLPGNRGLSGLAVVHGVSQYVSPGLAYSSTYPFPGFRLFNRPRVTILTLSARFAQSGSN